MDFKDLTYIIAIAKYENITKAANSLYISQPTLTKFLQNLENSLDQKLFKKLGNRFILTYAGERYVSKSKEILQLKKELDIEMADIIKSNVGVLNIAFPVMRGTYMLPNTLPIFKSLYPNVYLNVEEADSGTLEEKILSGTTDIAFFNLPIRSNDIAHEIISHEEILLVMARDFPFANCGVEREGCKYPWIDLSIIKDETFILQLPQQRTRQIIDNLLSKNGIEPKKPLITRNINAAVELAAKKYGITFVNETHLKHIHLDKDAAVFFSCGDPNTTIDFVVAYRKNSYLSYHAQEYIKIVKTFI